MVSRLTIISLPSGDEVVSDFAVVGHPPRLCRGILDLFAAAQADESEASDVGSCSETASCASGKCGSFNDAKSRSPLPCPPAPVLRPVMARSLSAMSPVSPTDFPRQRPRWPSAFTLSCLVSDGEFGSETSEDGTPRNGPEESSLASPNKLAVPLAPVSFDGETVRISWGIDVGVFNGRATVQIANDDLHIAPIHRSVTENPSELTRGPNPNVDCDLDSIGISDADIDWRSVAVSDDLESTTAQCSSECEAEVDG